MDQTNDQIKILFLVKIKIWPGRDLNTQPSALEADALPLRHQVYTNYMR